MPLIAGIAAPIVGGVVGNLFGSGDRKKAQQAQEQALREIQGVSIPSIDELKVELEKYRLAGQLTPEMEEAILQEASRMEEIKVDPRLKQAQMSALNKLQQMGTEGLTAEDRFALNQVRGEVARDAQGRSEAILQNMAQRGIAGSGNELAAQLANNQAATQMQSDQSMKIAADANRRALEAILQSGNLGGQLREQDFGEQAQIAKAADAIAQFNVQNRRDVQQRNVGSRNRAQEINLNNLQDIMNRNVGLSNQQQLHNTGILADDFNRRFDKATAVAGQERQRSQDHQANAQRKAQMFQNIGTGVGQGAAAYGAYQSGIDQRDFEEKQANAQRQFMAEQNELNRKAYGNR